MSKYSKLFISLGKTASLAGYALSDGTVTRVEIAALSVSLVQDFLVWLVPNYTPPKEPV